jgi:hypothetical protein
LSGLRESSADVDSQAVRVHKIKSSNQEAQLYKSGGRQSSLMSTFWCLSRDLSDSTRHDVARKETSGFGDHPAEALSGLDTDTSYMKATGIVDPQLLSSSAAQLEAEALKINLHPRRAFYERPDQDLRIPRGSQPISAYNNLDHFTNLFPYLFPMAPAV